MNHPHPLYHLRGQGKEGTFSLRPSFAKGGNEGGFYSFIVYTMLEKLAHIEKKYLELRDQMMDPEIVSDNKKSIQLSKELSGIQEIYDLYQDYKKAHQQKKEAQEMIDTEKDFEMIEMAKEQLKESEKIIADLDQKIKVALLPKDPNDEKNIFLEIRPAA